MDDIIYSKLVNNKHQRYSCFEKRLQIKLKIENHDFPENKSDSKLVLLRLSMF